MAARNRVSAREALRSTSGTLGLGEIVITLAIVICLTMATIPLIRRAPVGGGLDMTTVWSVLGTAAVLVSAAVLSRYAYKLRRRIAAEEANTTE